MKGGSLLLAAGLTIVSLLRPSAPAMGFYQEGDGDARLHLNGFLSTGLGLALYPEDEILYDAKRNTPWSTDLRLLAEGHAGERLRAGLNILQYYRSTPAFTTGNAGYDRQDVERSALLFLSEHGSGNTRAAMVLDTCRLAYGNGSSEISLGRQPVSLSVNFYFTPNDFFAPFAPQRFYRVYRPGVDALRYERRLANLSQLTLVGVLGYDRDRESDSGWSRSPNWDRTSVLGRYIVDAAGFEWGALGGLVWNSPVAGASLQGELWQWLGIRAEGHYLDSRQDELASGLRVSVGLEHRFAGNLTVRLEQMYNSADHAAVGADAGLPAAGAEGVHPGRHYTGFDIGYEFTPLLRTEFLHLRNWSDGSRSYSLYGVYSLSDESELALTVSFPAGDPPGPRSRPSEFGQQPVWCGLEYRHYF